MQKISKPETKPACEPRLREECRWRLPRAFLNRTNSGAFMT
jgi:hypothetical protein